MSDATVEEKERFWRTRAFWEDFVERFVATFIEALIGSLPVVYSADIDWVNALYIAFFSAMVFSLKGIVAAINNPETGASAGTAVPARKATALIDESSPTERSAGEGSELEPGTPVKVEEALDE